MGTDHEKAYQDLLNDWGRANISSPKTADDLYLRDLLRCKRAYESGNMGGLYDALCICKSRNMIVPEWALAATIKHMGDTICETIDKKRGRNSKWKTQYKQDMIDIERAVTVQECSEHSIPWDHVYYAASLILQGSFAAGAEHAVEASYKRFTKRFKVNPHRYYKSEYLKIEGDVVGAPMAEERRKIWDEVNNLRRKQKKR